MSTDLTKTVTFQSQLTAQAIEQFESATLSEFTFGNPPTLPTIFRKGEFEWLGILNIDLSGLLHTEQEYEYFEAIRPGAPLEVRTRIVGDKERRGMRFVTAETEVHCDSKLSVRSLTSFLIRTAKEATP